MAVEDLVMMFTECRGQMERLLIHRILSCVSVSHGFLSNKPGPGFTMCDSVSIFAGLNFDPPAQNSRDFGMRTARVDEAPRRSWHG
jgi:hypothetical protein